jgi:hypothetical protein
MVLIKLIAEHTKSRTGAIIKQQAKLGKGGMQITVSRFGGYAKQSAGHHWTPSDFVMNNALLAQSKFSPSIERLRAHEH